jgi:hypothetical protein
MAQTETLAPIGHNKPPTLAQQIAEEEGDFAQLTTEYLEAEYAKQKKITVELLAEATALMRDEAGKIKAIDGPEMKSKVVSLIRRMRDHWKALDAFHTKEKQPYKRGGEAGDQFFFGDMDKLGKRTKTSNPGAADILGQILTDHDNKLLAEEQERRRVQAEEDERVAREAQAERDRLQREADEAAEAAARARNPERKEEKQEVAQEAMQAASTAAVTAAVTTARAEESYVSTLAKPADIVRTRHDDGSMSTMAQESYAEIVDRNKLPMAILWPHIPLDGLQKAVMAYAKLNNYNVTLEGAAIGRRNKSRVK